MKHIPNIITITLWLVFSVLLVFQLPAVLFLFVTQLMLAVVFVKGKWSDVVLNVLILELVSIIMMPILNYFGIIRAKSLLWHELMASAMPLLILVVVVIFGQLKNKGSRLSNILFSAAVTIMLMLVCANVIYALKTTTKEAMAYDIADAKNGDRIIIKSKSKPGEALSSIVGDNPVFEEVNYRLYQIYMLKDAGDGYFYIRGANGRYLCSWCHEVYDRNRVDMDRFQNIGTMKWRLYDVADMGQVIGLYDNSLFISNSHGDKQYGLTVNWSGDDEHFVIIEKAPNLFNRIGVLARFEGKEDVFVTFSVYVAVCAALSLMAVIKQLIIKKENGE